MDKYGADFEAGASPATTNKPICNIVVATLAVASNFTKCYYYDKKNKPDQIRDDVSGKYKPNRIQIKKVLVQIEPTP